MFSGRRPLYGAKHIMPMRSRGVGTAWEMPESQRYEKTGFVAGGETCNDHDPEMGHM